MRLLRTGDWQSQLVSNQIEMFSAACCRWDHCFISHNKLFITAVLQNPAGLAAEIKHGLWHCRNWV